jgi:hypothetical protein
VEEVRVGKRVCVVCECVLVLVCICRYRLFKGEVDVIVGWFCCYCCSLRVHDHSRLTQ